MDGYPPHATPIKDAAGWQIESFDNWWSRIGQETFPGVPDDIAEHWIHEHWDGSPFGGLASAEFTYHAVDWSLAEWEDVVSSWDNFSPVRHMSLLKGKELVTRDRKLVSLADYMATNHAWPVRPIVLDNRNGAVTHHPDGNGPLPSTFVLIEGHTRFNVAAYLMERGEMREPVALWLMVPRF